MGADAKCTHAAEVSLLPKNLEWTAWISDGTNSPTSGGRMETTYAGYYKLADGSVLAHGWNELVAPPLKLSITIDESGNPVQEPLFAWSNTLSTGESAGAEHCNNWTSSTFSSKVALVT